MRGDRLAKLREERGYTQLELAEMMGLGPQQIWRYENGLNDPRSDVLARIAQIFGVTSDYLLGLVDYPEREFNTELRESEREAILAWRRGDKLRAIEIIVLNGKVDQGKK
jgi:transcriptional regulator with XRE-family HTH domain